MKSWLVIGTAVLALAVVGGAGYLGLRTGQAEASPTQEAPPTVAVSRCDVEQSVTAPGNLVNTREVVLRMPVDGRLEEILVQAGEEVQEGQPLARLGEREKYAAEVSAAELELLQARQALAQLQESASQTRADGWQALVKAQEALEAAQRARSRLDYPRADELVIEKARADYALAKQEYKEAEKAFNKVAHKRLTDPDRVMALNALLDAKTKMERALANLNWYLLEPGENEIAEADAALAVAQASLAEAQANWEHLESGVDPVELALAEASVENAETRLAAAQTALASLELRAPFNGVVLEVKTRPGETLAAGQPVIVLNDPKALEVVATVIEEDFPNLKAGQAVDLFFDALPEAQVVGEVSRIVPVRVPGDRPLYSVYISLDGIPAGLVAGMTADASIKIAQALDALCLPRTVVRASAGDSAVLKVWAGGQIEERTVGIGLRGDVNVEIVSGLEEGVQVLR